MKKFLALAALVLGLASCQTEPEGLDVNVGGEQEVMLTVSLPEATRASSAQGFDLSTLTTSNYSLRYILEVYRVNEGTVLYDNCQRFVQTSDATTTAFPVRLAPGYNYRIVAWTDIVEGNSEADRCYKTTDGLDAVEIIESMWKPMDETRDAYTAVSEITNFNSSSNLDMTLTRPFAKLRVVATDIDDIRKVGLEPTTATVEYSQDMYFKYNAVADIDNEGVANDAREKSHTFTYPATPVYQDDAGELTLFADYIFVPESGTAKFSLNVYADANGLKLIKDNNFNTEIFVERSKLTTIKGDVLTIGGDVKVTVDNELGVKEVINIADTANSLIDAINDAEPGKETNIELGGDIDLGDLFAGILSTRAAATLPIVIPEDKVVALDLNGYKITTPWEDQSAEKHYYAFENYGSLTIQDSSEGKTGEIIARGIFNYGTMTLESGKINACDHNGGYGVRNYEGTFTMNGGSIVTSNEDGDEPGDGYDATTLRIDEGATATINGGSINNISNYTLAIENHGTTTIKGGTFTSVHTTIGNHSTMTIDGGSFTCNGLEGITAHALWAAAGTTTINGGTFDGKDNYNGFNVDAQQGAVVNINGGKFLPVHSGSLYGDGTINVMGGEFFDNPSKFVNDDYTVVETENGLWTVALKNVIAKIGEVEYRTLQKAFDAVEEGANTIVLVDDVNVNAAVVLAEGKTATLDLNGKTLTATDYAIENNGTLTITGDGTINGVVYGENGTTTVENGTFNPADGGAYVFLNSTAGTLTINGGTINTGSSYPVYSYNENNKLIINDVIINGKFGCVNAYGTNGSVEINGGTFQMTGVQGKTSHITYFSSNIVATINGGTFEKIGDISMSATGGGGICANGGANLTINGGTFAGDHDDVYNYGGTISVKGGEYKFKPDFVADGYKVVEENGAYKVVSDPVAKIGDTEYNSLQAAIEAVKEGETIVMQRDLNITTPAYGQNALNHAKAVSFTLDLNGKTLSADTGNSVFRYNITQTGATSNITITFKNGTITSGDKTWCTVMAAGLSNDVKAIFNLENLTINASKAGDLAVKAWDYAVINANNVTVNATKCAGGFYAVGGEIVLTNCTVNQEGLDTAPYLSMAVAVSNGGKATVNSGNYTAEPTAASEGYNQGTSHGSWCAGVMNSGGELIINGGTFANGNFGDDALATAARGLIFGDTASNIVINDGTFNALKTVIDYQNNLGIQPNPNIVINGGNFSANPAVVTSYGGVVLAEGKVAAQGADGRWTLVDGVMDEAGLKAAFEQGGNIVLGADITVSETIVLAEGKTVVLDLNGKTLAAVDMNTIKNNGGNLTLKNGTVTRTGDVVGYSVNNASGEINVVDATVERGLYTSGSKMTATNANISHEQSSRHAIYAWDCEVTINSGIFHNDNAGNATLMASGSSVVTINGGTFSIADGRSALGWTSSMIDQNSTAQVIVKGGLFNGGFRINSADTTLTIEGGEFNTNNGSAFTDYSGTKVVKGGKFTDTGAQNWAKKYIAEGYEMNANGEVLAK